LRERIECSGIAAERGIDPALLHRVAVMSAGTLDTLPHNGAIVTLLAVCGTTHRESYFDIVMVAIVGAILALVAVIALGSGQRSTARDMALLAIQLRRRFPHHYHYFGNRSFAFAGREIRGHNELLDRVVGADGLKTGFIRASGYNLATSVSTGGRSVVAVVMGGETARSRNEHMEHLIREFLPMASTQTQPGPALALQ
jgi:hypothetical protein